MSQYSEELFKQLYKDGLIGPVAFRNYQIKQKIDSLPGKLSKRVKDVAKAMNLSTRTIYRAIKQ